MEIYFPECPIKSGVAREENFSFWKKCLGDLEEVIIPPSGRTPSIKDKFPGCECKAHLKVQPYGCSDLIPYRIYVSFYGPREERKDVSYTCVGKLDDEVSGIIKKDELEKMLMVK